MTWELCGVTLHPRRSMDVGIRPDFFAARTTNASFCAFVVFAYWVAGHGAGEATLWADRQAIKIDITRGLFCSPPGYPAFEHKGLGADESSTTCSSGTKRSGAKSPALAVSYSSRKWFTLVFAKKRSATDS